MNYNLDMFYYFLIALMLVIYFEISGRLFLSLIDKNKFKLAFPFGLMLLMAYAYLSTGIFTYLNCSFYLIFAIYSLYFIISILLIIKYRKKIAGHISILDWSLVFIFVFIMLFYAYNTTLGDTNGFDSTYYLNLISNNIEAANLNTTDLYYGGYASGQSAQYTFQSYYYFASCFTYLAVRLLTYFTTANNYSVIIWIFQILFNFFFASLVINSCDYLCRNKKYLKYVFIFIFLFFEGKLYWNNVFGFFGNTYRKIAIGYTIMALDDLLREDRKENWILFGICLLSTCAFSSTGIFTIIFLLFGCFFLMVKTHNNLFKYYVLLLFIPLINLICVIFELPLLIIFTTILILCFMLYKFNNYLIIFFNKKYILTALFCLSFLLTFILSFKVTHNIFDFSAFFDNYSEKADMTINYFADYSFLGGNNEIAYRILILSLLGYSFIFEHNNQLIKIFIIIFLIFFSPFNCAFINKINVVYYRGLDVIINPFTIILFANMLFNRINNKYFYYLSLSALLLIFIKNTNFKTPLYYHKTFMPPLNYNHLMKMSNDEFDILNKLKAEVDYKAEKKYLVSANLFTESIIPNQKYLYCRELKINSNWNDAERQVYAIFYPPAYLGDGSKEIKADYDNMAEYIKESGINYLIMDKKIEYYDHNTDSYGYLMYALANCGYGYPIYENDSYLLYCFDYE